jgi:hypothetical protein
MANNNAKPLKLALHGMDSRAVKTMMLFLQGPCKGEAFVVIDAEDADVDIFDADASNSKKLLENHLQTEILRPVVVLSLHEFVHEGVLHLAKPIKTSDMLSVLNQAKTLTIELSKKTAAPETSTPSDPVEKDDFDLFNDELFEYISSSSWDEPPAPQSAAEILRVVTAPEKVEPKPLVTDPVKTNKLPGNQTTTISHPNSVALSVDNEPEEAPAGPQAQELETSLMVHQEGNVRADNPNATSAHLASSPQTVSEEIGQKTGETERQELKTYVSDLERNRTPKHQTAMRLDDKGFHDYIGEIEEINVNDPKQFDKAQYDPNDYYQGTVQSAFAECLSKGQILLLTSNWLSVTLFPNTREVWLNANDIEIKGFAGIKLKRKTVTETTLLATVDPKTTNEAYPLDKFENIEAFMWKLACWTSKGRYPQDIDYRLPVYLNHWPNFTRLLITPHALRIAALLIQGPRTMGNIAQMLKIEPQYAFIFISAAHAIGIANQAKRVADSLVQAPDVQPNKAKGLLGKIMKKLRN